MASMIEGTLRHAQFLSRHLGNCDLQCAAITVLLELRVPTKSAGFDYLKNAIIMFCENPTQSITKELYPKVGKCYDPKVGSYLIEIAIRRVISIAWESRDEELWGCFFFPDEGGNFPKPTNAEFISMLAYFLELCQGCGKEGVYEEA